MYLILILERLVFGFKYIYKLHLFGQVVIGVRGGGGGVRGGGRPPNLVRNINYLGNFYLRVGQSSCSGFVLLIFLIFSFHLSLAP